MDETLPELPTARYSHTYIVTTHSIIQYQLYVMVHSTCIGCSTQTGQHERCKRECCPVWVLQYICWISIGKRHVHELGNLATGLYEPSSTA